MWDSLPEILTNWSRASRHDKSFSGEALEGSGLNSIKKVDALLLEDLDVIRSGEGSGIGNFLKTSQ